ncbi:MAG: RNA methyltransferase [Bacteroidota bacterium]
MPISKNKAKYIRSLRQKKFRQKYNKFVAEGAKLALEILQDTSLEIELVLATETWVEKYAPLLKRRAKEVIRVKPVELKPLSVLQTPNQVLLVASIPNYALKQQVVQTDWSLYLDTVQDPGNLGTILRIADWFGIQHIFCSPDTADVFNPKVIQSTMGAFLRTNVLRTSLLALKEQFPELPFVGAMLGANSIYTSPLPRSGILVMGNESKGIGKEQQELLTEKISIPAHTASGMESLNVGVATGIICAEIRRLYK